MGLFDFITGGKDPYKNDLNAARQGQNQQFDELGNLRAGYGGLARDAGNLYAPDNAAARQATQGYADLLRRGMNPTGQERSAYIGARTANVNDDYTAGASHLASNLAARGLTDSGLMAGGLSALENRRVGAVAGAQNSAANFFDARAHDYGSQLVGLLGGQANQDYSHQLGAMGAQTGITDSLAADYGGNAQHLQQLSDNWNARKGQGLMQLLQTGAQIYGASQGVPGRGVPAPGGDQAVAGSGGTFQPGLGSSWSDPMDPSGGFGGGMDASYTTPANNNFGYDIDPYTGRPIAPPGWSQPGQFGYGRG